jgi:lipopolysaccharide/colanic/teichoic acid biosynthesis glycosyltransferase
MLNQNAGIQESFGRLTSARTEAPLPTSPTKTTPRPGAESRPAPAVRTRWHGWEVVTRPGRLGAARPGAYDVTKRLIDVLAASAALTLLLPAFAVIAVCIWCEDRGPVIYRQTRVGRDGRVFRFYKFRTMVRDADRLKAMLLAQNEADGPIFKMRHDPRVTRVGRFLRARSLDELPQFFNVLRGDMSLVGPRPHLPSEVAHYTPRQRTRLSVQPGLICLREVQGRSRLTFEEWVESDLDYIGRRSLRTDAGILLRAVPAVLKGEGAY